jgi:hypothetical protein
MSINGINNSQPAFTAKTKDGNDYDKTNAGKAVGGVLGGIAVARGLTRTAIAHKALNDDKFLKTFCENAKAKGTVLPDGKGVMLNSNRIKGRFESIKNMAASLKGSAVVGGVIGSVIAGTMAYGLGALVDKMINNHEAKKADKAAE